MAQVVCTYLEMRRPDEHVRAPIADPDTRFERIRDCRPDLYRRIYHEIGRKHRWRERLRWSDADVRRHLARSGVALFFLYYRGLLAGYFELERHADGSTEIAHIGILDEFLGRGLGKQMLSAAIDQAWLEGARRVWLHTSTLDHPRALPTYLNRGFRPFKQQHFVVRGA